MKNTENQEVVNYKERLLERARGYKPERFQTAENGQDGQGEQDYSDAMYQTLAEDFDDKDNRLKEYEDIEGRMNKMFNSDPRSAEFLNRWADGENPLFVFIEMFGEDALDELQTPEGKEKYQKAYDTWLQKKTDDESTIAEREKNFSKSISDLEKFGNERGLDDEKKLAIFSRLTDIGSNSIDGIYTVEDMEMALNAINHDNDVESARHEGEVNGRNAKIKDVMRKTSTPSGMPPALTGQGMNVPERRPEKPRKHDPWMLGD